MLFTTSIEAHFARTFLRFLYLNPFELPLASELRQQLVAMDLNVAAESLGQAPIDSDRPQLIQLIQKLDAWLLVLRQRIGDGAVADSYTEQQQFEALVMGALFYRHFEGRQPLREAGDGSHKVPSYRPFEREVLRWNELPLKLSPFLQQPAHMFAVFFQLRRAFDLIVQLVQGNSRPICRLRAEIWHSIFPHELQLYGSLLYDRMQDITTLILGQSGTGKDLVAKAIGLSRYIPFDPSKVCFTECLAGAFHPINLSAMPLDLIESEMFGHSAGAFTGATQDRQGWFEKCGFGHAVFLDEIGELDLSIQVKLLRVLQNREYFRVGESEPRRFTGKVVAATNRNLGQEIVSGRFRQDLFYRLCSDQLTTPSLREQLDDAPDELPHLVRIVAARCLGDRAWPEQIDWLTRLTVSWIESSPTLGPYYDWPGNFRELEQCVRNVMVRGQYHPVRLPTHDSPLPTQATAAIFVGSTNPAVEAFLKRVRASDLTYDELLNYYCSLVFSRSEHLTAAASQLEKHRATIQARVRPDLVAEFRGTGDTV
jgi:transcriptional regulator with AAA-type ATPase domain